jgi:hypothetical protein
MTSPSLDPIREGVLLAMDRQDRLVRLAVFGAASLELLMLAVAILLIDWNERTQVLLLILAVLGYSVVLLGLVALGAHVSRCVGQLAGALHRDALGKD